MTVKELISKLSSLDVPEAKLRILYDGACAACGVSDAWLETEEDENGRWEAGDVIIRTDQ